MKELYAHKTILAPVAVNLLVIILTAVVIVRGLLPPEVPLFYGRAVDEERLAPNFFLLIPPVIALGILVVNTLLNMAIKDEFLQKIFFASTVATTALATIAVLKIIFLVGSF